MLRTSLAAAFAVSLAAPALAAPDGPARGERMFERLDANKDGVLTADELGARVERLMEADANKDGKLTKAEIRDFHEARMAEHEKRRFPDENGDGVVSRSEWSKSRDAAFDELDANKDGKLTREELEAAHGMHRHHRR